MKVVLASKNKHKLEEISKITEKFGIDLILQSELGVDIDVEENGATFAENALIKARAAAKALGCIALADDSGLCVDALGGAPGIYSARYAGEHGSDKANRDLLLKNMQNIADRRAYFISAIALVYPDGKELVAEGRTYGKVLYEEQGDGGFGYDCIFESDDLKKSFGLASAEEKNAVSHRFRGLQAMVKLWEVEEK